MKKDENGLYPYQLQFIQQLYDVYFAGKNNNAKSVKCDHERKAVPAWKKQL